MNSNLSLASFRAVVLLTALLVGPHCVLAVGTIVIDPDAFPAGTILNNAFPGVTLSAHDLPVGSSLPNDQVLSVTSPFASTGTRVFAHQPGPDATWGNGVFEYLRVDFASGASEVTLDFIANDDGNDSNAQLLAYNALDVLVDIDTAPVVVFGSPVTLTVTAPDIRYVYAYWDEITRVENGALDHLTYTPVPEAAGAAMAAVALLVGVACRRRHMLR